MEARRLQLDPSIEMELETDLWIRKCGEHRIADQESYDQAVGYLSSIGSLEEDIMGNHREPRKLLARLAPAKKCLKDKIAQFIEDQRKKQAVLASQAHMQTRDLLAGAAPDGLNRPIVAIIAPPVQRAYIPSEKISRRERWKMEIEDIRLMCRAIADGSLSPMYIIPDMSKLNDLANAERSALRVPGLRAVPDINIAVNRRK
jgi:hypothetical protein